MFITKFGLNVNIRDALGSTPLHLAAARGLYKMVQVLLDHGADINNAETKTGWTPLHAAAAHNDVKVVQLLLDRGANRHIVDLEQMLPLTLAKIQRFTDVVNLLRVKFKEVPPDENGLIKKEEVREPEGSIEEEALLNLEKNEL